MNALPNERQIYVSTRLWHEIHHQVNLKPFSHVLHASLDLSKYGEGLKKFYYNFLIMPATSKVLEPYAHYSRKKQEADVSTAINYELLYNASEEEAIKLMEDAYLRGISQLEKLPLKKSFDVARFKQDVEAIFSREKWYELAEAA